MSPARLRSDEDAFGHALWDYHTRGVGEEVIERDDGFVEVNRIEESIYFSGPDQWPACEHRALQAVGGRVLDVGCGAGRVALHVQKQGHPVTAIDVSPLAVRTAKARGVRDARVLPMSRVAPSLGHFDAVVMMGATFAAAGNAASAGAFLKRLGRITAEDAVVAADMIDPYQTDRKDHFAYHRRNRKRGRMPGQIRIRIRYRGWSTKWFDILFLSPKELERVVKGTGWEVARLYDAGQPWYSFVLGRR